MVTLEQAAITVVGVVASAVVYLYKQQRDDRKEWLARSEKCEKWREEKEPVIHDLERKYGALSVLANLVSTCKHEGCAFSGRSFESYSVLVRKHQPKPPNPPQ